MILYFQSVLPEWRVQEPDGAGRGKVGAQETDGASPHSHQRER